MELSGAVRVPLDLPGPKEPSAPAGRDPWLRPMLGAALLLCGLRFVGLGHWSLWLDEALTLADARHGSNELNPLGYALFRAFYGISAGRPDEFLMRLPAAVLGCASILSALWALRPFVGARAATFSALLLAASPWHMYWSQNARFYTLAQTLALLGGGLLLRGLYGESSKRTVSGVLLLVGAAVTHPSAVFLIAPLLCLPWLVRFLEWIPASKSRAFGWFAAAGLLALVVGSGWVLKVRSTWELRQGSGDPLHFAKTVGYLLGPAVGVCFFAGAWRGRVRRENFVPLYATLLACLGAALASFFVRVSAQYVFVLQPWIAAVAGLAFFPRAAAEPASERRHAWLALAVVAPALLETALYFGLRHGDRPRWREAYVYVYEHRGPDDLVLGMDAPVAEYYFQPNATDLRNWSQVTWFDDYRGRLPQDWARYDRRTWFVVNRTLFDDWGQLPASAENRAEAERILREECVLVARFDVPLTPRDLDLEVYVTRHPELAPGERR
jgi:hypothetical protein